MEPLNFCTVSHLWKLNNNKLLHFLEKQIFMLKLFPLQNQQKVVLNNVTHLKIFCNNQKCFKKSCLWKSFPSSNHKKFLYFFLFFLLP